MLPRFRCLLFCLLLVAWSTAAVAADRLVQVGEHVFSYVDTHGAAPANSFGANAGIVVGERGILVVDTLVSAKEGRRLLTDLRKITAKPILYVVNTHYHLDHVLGNAEFVREGAVVVAQENCLANMRQRTEQALANAQDWGLTAEDMAGTTVAYPSLTFSRRMTIDLGGVTVELLHVAPSHTSGNLLVRVPGDKVLFTGDILFTNYHPYMVDGDIPGWVRTLDAILAMDDVDRIIPGHGPVSGKGDVEDMKNYLTSFDLKARQLTAKSSDLEAIALAMQRVLPPRAELVSLIKANLQPYLKGR